MVIKFSALTILLIIKLPMLLLLRTKRILRDTDESEIEETYLRYLITRKGQNRGRVYFKTYWLLLETI